MHDKVSARLGLPISSTSIRHHAQRQSRMNKKMKYEQSDWSKEKRLIAKMTCLHKMGLVTKDKCHKSGKVSLKEDSKSCVGVISCEKCGYCKPPSCSICKQVGHNRTQCLIMPPMLNRSKAELVSFDNDDMIELWLHKSNKKEMGFMVSAEKWI